MKFTDGYWLLRPGVTAHFPQHVHDVEPGDGTLTAHAPTHRVRHRGDLLKGPVATIGLSSPMPDVVRVSVTHFSGGHDEVGFELSTEDGHRPKVEVDEQFATLTSGSLTARVHRGEDWRLEFTADGRTLTSSDAKAMGFMTLDGEHHVREQLALGVGEVVYGMGERFGPLTRNGQVVDIWNADGGTSSEQAYKNAPFYLTSAGYGVFVDHPGKVSFEVGSEAVSRVGFSVPGQRLDYLVIHGPTPKEVLRKYTALTGRPALPPDWSFGLWLSTSFTTSYDEKTVTGFIDGMAERDLPLSVFHFDCFWMRGLHWCDFEWDPEVFPDPEGMLARLKERGLSISVWINPYIAQRSPLFEEGRKAGYLLRRPTGEVWQWDLWQPGMALVDFTNPEARDWYAGKLERLLDQGVDCFKTDFGERVPTDVVYHDGSDPERMHNLYTHLYNKTVFDLLLRRKGENEAVVFARSATAGTQQFPVHWGGDSESSYAAMAESLRGGLSLGLTGFGFWSHDIGGFEGTPDPDLFKRWTAFGLLSSHSRLHGSSSYRVPWAFDEEAVDVLRRFTKLKLGLMPYLKNAARQAAEHGVPVMRAMALEFPHDPACAHLDRQYMLGDDLLVAPVFTPTGEVEFYVPEGVWTSHLTGERLTGPRWHRQTHDHLSIPLLVRPGAVVPVGAVDDRPDYDHAEGVSLHCHELADGSATEVRVGESRFTVHRDGDTVRATARNPPAHWRLVLPGGRSVDAENGVAEAGSVSW
ncbi:alpha-xylosidase [Actinosynnema pretiosum subsp. pretiosum]|uniref:alpha-D-xyloside xylohydrolase n=2 Tax=Actinosynnema TaxID=40566 RepID=C6WRR4_ACTMD|nr:alpha-xylosidase [Actinosynnema mirum]ACU36906.1 glycoside hydrolase family 31 [Actinosynnema mirum DSM 43827]AXX30376.1 Alpha-xylosidase [Actinosynnema pretiosum subsp. pretiosum]QUF05476.1 alpha-xylosidase [Actinosynnema pretiosum subsp. pretiosum]